MNPNRLQPFRVDIDPATIERIHHRLTNARWAAAPDDDADWTYGTDARWLRSLVEHWVTRYDWRAAEHELNRWPQFMAEVAGQRVHFYHVKGSAPRPRPLLLTHGWPGSVLEFLGCVERLAHPQRFGGQAEDGFDLVIPSLPGYAFSQRPSRPIGPRAVARMWRELMVDVLGYPAFAAQGGDWGAAVTNWLGAEHADVTRAIHLNMVPSWALQASAAPDAEEAQYLQRVAAMRAKEMGYHAVQSTKPQTLALALADTPLGFAAWVCEKFRTWSDTREGDIHSRFDRDTLITNLMLYLVNDAAGTSLWMYRGRADEFAAGGVAPRVEVPTGIALFPAEIIPYPPRAMVERGYAVARWTPMPAGGHFAALEEPVAFSDEVRAFFRQIGY
ncbi:epoxide hydrolase family protein [Hydrogenophaga sp.]|uniref:epoxide hydrolase family protein n=1 Tax=Hydrogenophaga sp. TaxID=1904254 RepID=UPI00262DBAB4|nr:epoxide hydrolase family protein [Hydrogenophaga sp.]MCW5655294.1 epoxide hydrolase [Hydrogenophaga sp.]